MWVLEIFVTDLPVCYLQVFLSLLFTFFTFRFLFPVENRLVENARKVIESDMQHRELIRHSPFDRGNVFFSLLLKGCDCIYH